MRHPRDSRSDVRQPARLIDGDILAELQCATEEAGFGFDFSPEALLDHLEETSDGRE